MKTRQDWQFHSGDVPVSNSRTMTIISFLVYLSCANLLLIATAPLARLYFHTPGFLTFRIMLIAILIGVLFGVLTLVMLAILAITKTPIVWRPILSVIMIGFSPPLFAIFMTGIDVLSKPLIHDISTDVDDPPVYQEIINLRQADDNSTVYNKDVAPRQLAAYPEINPIHTDLSVNDALTESTQVVKDLRWELVNLDFETGIIEAYDTSKLFGFIDDIIIRVRPDGSGSRIDIRSSSRVGKGDLGKNADRILNFIDVFRT